MGSEDLSTFDIGPFLHELTANIVEGGANDGIKLLVEAHPLKVGLDFAVPLGLLVTELVTNSLKHAYPKGSGNISVSLRREPVGKVVVVVADDGRVQSDGEDPLQYSNGLGACILQRLVAQLDGTMIVTNDTWTTTELHIPMPVQS
jgi:two-component sensor histidine kinase